MLTTTATTTTVTFVTPPPGLEPVVDFVLSDVDGAVGLYTLRDTTGADLRLFLIDPAFFVPEYMPEFTEEQLAPLGADDYNDLQLFVVAHLAEEAPVVNLLAPIVINPTNGTASQVILDADEWPLQAELIPSAA